MVGTYGFIWREKRKLLHHIGRSLRACLLGLLSSHTLILTTAVATLSLCTPLVTDPAGSPPPGKRRRCNIHAVVVGDGSDPLQARPNLRALPFSPTQRQLGREHRPLLPRCRSVGRSGPPVTHLATSWQSSGITSFETCLALLPQLLMSLHVYLFLLLSPPRRQARSAVPKPPHFLLLEVKLLHAAQSITWFK
jgi:hypothetical protein